MTSLKPKSLAPNSKNSNKSTTNSSQSPKIPKYLKGVAGFLLGITLILNILNDGVWVEGLKIVDHISPLILNTLRPNFRIVLDEGQELSRIPEIQVKKIEGFIPKETIIFLSVYDSRDNLFYLFKLYKKMTVHGHQDLF